MIRTEHAILAAGAVFVVAVIGAAMIPDDVWERSGGEAGVVIAHAVGAGGGIANPAMIHPVAPMAPMAAGQVQGQVMGEAPGGGMAMNVAGAATPAQAPGGAWGRGSATRGLIPFTRAKTQPFSGRVASMVVLGGDVGWGQVHIWVGDVGQPVQQVSLGPDWYLNYLGCAVAENAMVRGIAFKFDNLQSNVELYAKTLTVNGLECRLRNDEGFALWSNQLQ
ncbi:MAG: hypothetical protein ABT940_07605 [Alphaproteobacteria bacterium]